MFREKFVANSFLCGSALLENWWRFADNVKLFLISKITTATTNKIIKKIIGDFIQETKYAFFAVRDPREQTPDKSKDIPVLFRALYSESTLIKILPWDKGSHN